MFDQPARAVFPQLVKWLKWLHFGGLMQHISAREAKNGFGRLIDLARAEPVSIDKHGRPVVVVMSVEEYERLSTRHSRIGQTS